MLTTAGAWPRLPRASIAREWPTRSEPSRPGEPTTDLFYKVVRVYALAAIVVPAEARKKGQESVPPWWTCAIRTAPRTCSAG